MVQRLHNAPSQEHSKHKENENKSARTLPEILGTSVIFIKIPYEISAP